MAEASKAGLKRGDLTGDMVVEAALKHLDEVGMERFSVREVARSLGVFPAAVYWHVRGGRNGLLAAVVSSALAGVTPDLNGTVDWRDWLETLFRRYRAAVRRHPNVAPVLGNALVSNAGVQPEMMEGVLRCLEAAGYAGERLAALYSAVIAAMLGFATLELAPPPATEGDDWARDLEERTRALTTDHARYPALARSGPHLAGRSFVLRWRSGSEQPLEEAFEAYLRAFLDGLEFGRTR